MKTADDCTFCLGAKGGVPGNANLIGGEVVCDYCTALLLKIRDAEKKHPTGSIFSSEADTKRLDYMEKHLLREASMRMPDHSFKSVNAWSIASAGTNLRQAVDALMTAEPPKDPS